MFDKILSLFRGKTILALVTLISSFAFSQGWNDIKTTNINLENAQYAEMFSNSFGNNVILQNTNGSITYYVVNASTGLAGSAITVESSGASLAQITGEAQKVYVVYRKNNKITGKFTTDAGVNWTPLSQELNLSPSSLDVVAYDGKIHITYSLNSIAYYYQYNGSIWTNSFNVSNSGTGLTPRIEMLTTQNKVYVVFNSSNGSAKSRELTLPSTWASVQTLHSNVNYSNVAGFGVDANYLYLYYSSVYDNPPYWYYSLYTRKVQKSNYQTVDLSWESYNQTNFVQTTTTSDDKIHSAYTWYGVLGDGYQNYPLEPGLIHDSYNNGTRDGENVEVNYNYEQYENVEISSTSNDLFVLWKPATSNFMKYRQYDAVPLAPQNLTVSVYSVPDYQYPKLNWNLNNEPDVRINDDSYLIERRTRIAQGSWSSWTQIGYGGGGSSTYIDYGIGTAGDGFNDAEYRIRAKDINNHTSEYSSIVQIEYGHQGMEKKNIGTTTSIDFTLDQNYPNPFNPSTKILYSIKEEGLVTLKIYDILGKEIATLVNENKPAGNYEAEFNASQLPSGLYIYKIQSGQFSDVKKMLLTK